MRIVIAVLICSTSVFAESYLTVKGANVRRAKLAVTKLHPLPGTRVQDARLAGQITEQIQEDLEFINVFDFVPPNLFATSDTVSDFYKMNYANWSALQASFVLKVGYKIESGRVLLEALFYDVPGQKKIFGTRYQYPASQYKRLVHSMSEDILKAVTGEKGLFFSRILMTCRSLAVTKSPPFEIYVADSDGANPRALTRDKTLSMSPTWAPDGQKISYSQYEFRRAGKVKKKFQVLKTHDLRSGRRSVVSAREGMNSGPAFSPDGKTIAATLSFSGRPEIYLINLANINQPMPLSRSIQWRRISGTGFHNQTASTLFDVEATFSPDGKKVAISSARTGHPMLYVVDLATKVANQLTFAGVYNSSPTWSPTSDQIIFSAQRTDRGNFDLYAINSDGNNLARLTKGEPVRGTRRINSENASWGPTGRHYVYENNAPGYYVVMASTLDGKVHRQISPKGKECKNPAWSPAMN